MRVTAGYFRHCRRDNPHRGAAGWAYAYFWRLWIWNRNFQLLGSCVSDIGRWFLSRNLTNWRQPVAHAQPFRGQFRCCQQPAAVLCWPLCDPRLSSGRRGVEGDGRVFPALWAPRPSRWSSWPGIRIPIEVTLKQPRDRMMARQWNTQKNLIPEQLVTLRPIHIACPGRLALPTVCHRTTLWP